MKQGAACTNSSPFIGYPHATPVIHLGGLDDPFTGSRLSRQREGIWSKQLSWGKLIWKAFGCACARHEHGAAPSFLKGFLTPFVSSMFTPEGFARPATFGLELVAKF